MGSRKLLHLILLISSTSFADDTISVSTKTLSEIHVFPQYSAPATVISLNQSQISAQLNARINQVAVRVGDVVKKSQLLVKLDCQDAKLVRQSALARKQLAEKELSRGNQLKKSNSIATSNLNQRQTELIQAKIDHQTANLHVERCTITAPYEGVVTERIASVASLAAPGTPLISLVDTKNLELKASLSVSDVSSLAAAKNVSFTASAGDFPIQLRTILPLLDSQSNNRQARFDFIDKTPLPGSSGRIKWREASAHIPANVILERNGNLGVFIYQDGIAKFMTLEKAQTGQDVSATLPADTLIIIDGRFGLKPDDQVQLRASRFIQGAAD